MMKGESGWASDKTSRRALIAEDYRIIMIVGDQLSDFLPRQETALAPEERKDAGITNIEICGGVSGS